MGNLEVRVFNMASDIGIAFRQCTRRDQLLKVRNERSRSRFRFFLSINDENLSLESALLIRTMCFGQFWAERPLKLMARRTALKFSAIRVTAMNGSHLVFLTRHGVAGSREKQLQGIVFHYEPGPVWESEGNCLAWRVTIPGGKM